VHEEDRSRSPAAHERAHAHGSPTVGASIAALQRQAGNRVVTRLLQAPVGAARDDPPAVDRAAGHVLRATVGAVVQRKNAFWGESKASRRPNPLFAIANQLQQDAGVDPGTTLNHWRSGTNLAVAKTAKTALTTGSMAEVVRPEHASAWLDTPNPNPGTRKDPAWITAYGNLGTVEDQIVGDTPKKYNGGHLIAWEFLNEAANVPGNIAPQAMLQNQALYRRIERTLEETITKGGTGVEVTVSTPYRHDNTAVTYQQLIDRKVLTSDPIKQALANAGALGKSVPIAQMAPDTYDIYLLTQSGVTHPAKSDVREQREGVTTFPLTGYTDALANKLLVDKKPPPLSILASNVDPTTLEQTAVAFAHLVFLNYRTTASPVEDVRTPLEDDDLEERRRLAVEVIEENMALAVPILQALTMRGGLSPTEAETALVIALMDSEPPKPKRMDM